MRQKSELRAEETIVRPAGFSPVSSGMDIARPHIAKKKRRRRILFASGGALALIAITFALSQLKPAVPSVDRSTVWIDTVKRGPMVRQVPGLLSSSRTIFVEAQPIRAISTTLCARCNVPIMTG